MPDGGLDLATVLAVIDKGWQIGLDLGAPGGQKPASVAGPRYRGLERAWVSLSVRPDAVTGACLGYYKPKIGPERHERCRRLLHPSIVSASGWNGSSSQPRSAYWRAAGARALPG